MSKAKDLAKELYPDWEMTGVSYIDGQEESMVRIQRVAYIKGYHQAERDLTDKAKTSSGWDGFFYGQGYKQAEKDLELTWEDIRELYIIFAEVDVEIDFYKTDIKSETIGYYQEVLKRFKERKL